MDLAEALVTPEADATPADTSGMQKRYGGGPDDIRQAVKDLRHGQSGDHGGAIKPAVELPKQGVTVRYAADGCKQYRQRQAAERSALHSALGLEPSDDPNVGFQAARDESRDWEHPGLGEAGRAWVAEQQAQQPQQAQPAQRQQPVSADMLNYAAAESERAINSIAVEIAKAYPEIIALPPEQRQQALWEGYQKDPVRYAPAFAAINKANEIAMGTAQAIHQAQVAGVQRIQTYGEQEDKKFSQMHPGWDKDPKAADAIQKGALDYMRSKGFTEAEMQASWN